MTRHPVRRSRRLTADAGAVAPAPLQASRTGSRAAVLERLAAQEMRSVNAQMEILVREALAAAPWAVVVLGSAYQARTPKNPFSWSERAEMIRAALPEAERARVLFVPVRDVYDEPRWARSVRDGVAAAVRHDASGKPLV